MTNILLILMVVKLSLILYVQVFEILDKRKEKLEKQSTYDIVEKNRVIIIITLLNKLLQIIINTITLLYELLPYFR